MSRLCQHLGECIWVSSGPNGVFSQLPLVLLRVVANVLEPVTNGLAHWHTGTLLGRVEQPLWWLPPRLVLFNAIGHGGVMGWWC